MREDDGVSENAVIVVVEDDPNIADLVDLYLRRDGYRPYQVSTGERALEVIADRLAFATPCFHGWRPVDE